MTGPLEIEVKLKLASADDHAALLRALGAEGEPRRQRNRFLDGPRGELSAARLALRLREEVTAATRRTTLTLKLAGGAAGAVHQRVEFEAELDVPVEELLMDPARILDLDVAPVRELRRRLPDLASLISSGGFENERHAIPARMLLPGPGAETPVPLRWEVDRTDFGDGRVEHEVEVELPEAAAAAGLTPEALAAWVRGRLDGLGVRWAEQPESKFARFRRYRGEGGGPSGARSRRSSSSGT
jgi:hypothetical protein